MSWHTHTHDYRQKIREDWNILYCRGAKVTIKTEENGASVHKLVDSKKVHSVFIKQKEQRGK